MDSGSHNFSKKYVDALRRCMAQAQETNLKLSELNETLARRNWELTGTNRDLQNKIHEPHRTQAALREGEEHFRALVNKARIMRENLGHLSNQMLHVQEEERRRISRELHDEVGQALTAIHVNLAVLRKTVAPGSKNFGKTIADAQTLLEQTMETVHHFARELRPPMLDDLGLLPALRSYAKAFSERTGVWVSFHAWPGVEQLSSEGKTALYRVAQESLTNVAKHAGATQVAINIWSFKNGIRMEVKDNGKAFSTEQQMSAKGRKGMGLLGMRERVRLVNGQCVVESEPGKGTAVRVQIPFQLKAVNPHTKNGSPVLRNGAVMSRLKKGAAQRKVHFTNRSQTYDCP